MEIYVPSETEDVYVKLFNMITRINVVKKLEKLISCICKPNLDSVTFD